MKAIATAASGMRHAAMAVTEALLVAAIVAIVLFMFAPVAKPASLLAGAGEAAARGRTTATATGISAADGVFGGTTTVSTKPGLWVHVTCIANGSIGLSSWDTADATGHVTFHLGPTASWQSGGASCTADAGSFNSRSKFVVAASTTFRVTAS